MKDLINNLVAFIDKHSLYGRYAVCLTLYILTSVFLSIFNVDLPLWGHIVCLVPLGFFILVVFLRWIIVGDE